MNASCILNQNDSKAARLFDLSDKISCCLTQFHGSLQRRVAAKANFTTMGGSFKQSQSLKMAIHQPNANDSHILSNPPSKRRQIGDLFCSLNTKIPPTESSQRHQIQNSKDRGKHTTRRQERKLAKNLREHATIIVILPNRSYNCSWKI